MALIVCPECGRKNVSDSAEACPECGYGIRRHFADAKTHSKMVESDKTTVDAIQKETSNNKRVRVRVVARDNGEPQNDYSQKKEIELQRLKNILTRDSKLLIVWAIVAALLLTIAIMSFAAEFVGGGVLFLILCAIAGFIFSFYYSERQQAEKNIEVASNDYELYEKKRQETRERFEQLKAENQMRRQEEEKKQAELRKEKLGVNLTCPACGSSDIVKITSANRMGSIMVLGLASGKIGKQYRCHDCKHMW